MSKLPRRRSLSARIRAAFLTLGLVAIGLTGWQSYRIADTALEEAAYARLTAIRETKKRQIETYFRTVTTTVRTLADGEVAIDSILGFTAAGPATADYAAVERLHGETLRGYASALEFLEDVNDYAYESGIRLLDAHFASYIARILDGVPQEKEGRRRLFKSRD